MKPDFRNVQVDRHGMKSTQNDHFQAPGIMYTVTDNTFLTNPVNVWNSLSSMWEQEFSCKDSFLYRVYFKMFVSYFLCVCAWICICVPQVYSDLNGQKRAMTPLGLELQSVVYCYVVLDIKPGFSTRAASTVKHWAISSAQYYYFQNSAYSW